MSKTRWLKGSRVGKAKAKNEHDTTQRKADKGKEEQEAGVR